MWALVAVLFSLLLANPAPAGSAVSFQEIEESLTCQCGCGLTVASCNHLQCPSAIPLRQEIRQQMSEGLDKPAILAHFSEKYGEKILSAPTTQGFNLTAWLTPFIAVGLGIAIVAFTLLRWRRTTPRPVEASAGLPVEKSPDTAHEQILARELDKLDRE